LWSVIKAHSLRLRRRAHDRGPRDGQWRGFHHQDFGLPSVRALTHISGKAPGAMGNFRDGTPARSSKVLNLLGVVKQGRKGRIVCRLQFDPQAQKRKRKVTFIAGTAVSEGLKIDGRRT